MSRRERLTKRRVDCKGRQREQRSTILRVLSRIHWSLPFNVVRGIAWLIVWVMHHHSF